MLSLVKCELLLGVGIQLVTANGKAQTQCKTLLPPIVTAVSPIRMTVTYGALYILFYITLHLQLSCVDSVESSVFDCLNVTAPSLSLSLMWAWSSHQSLPQTARMRRVANYTLPIQLITHLSPSIRHFTDPKTTLSMFVHGKPTLLKRDCFRPSTKLMNKLFYSRTCLS